MEHTYFLEKPNYVNFLTFHILKIYAFKRKPTSHHAMECT